ncbi:hypothetical protein [Iodidimonas gelatinilytica]|nr:hypothetical protein [Iodidimonas gelatinilytica]
MKNVLQTKVAPETDSTVPLTLIRHAQRHYNNNRKVAHANGARS